MVNYDKPHSHGRLECERCHKVIASCRCMESGKTVEYMTCPKCRAELAEERMARTAEANEKLRELGISIPITKKDKNESGKD